MYKSFILPLFYYCCHLWDNCTKEQAQSLENLHLDALRTICGAVRGTSHEKLYAETNQKPLIKRREESKLVLFYKMVNDIAPSYLCNLLPNNVSDKSNYNLRNRDKFQTIRCKSNNYFNSFLPSTIRLWNNLPENITNANTVGQFRRLITSSYINKIFDLNFGSRFCQIIHWRLRLGCSDLNGDLYERFVSETSSCLCAYPFEDAFHYFFVCPRYHDIRNDLYFYKNGCTLTDVLFGNDTVSKETNMHILRSVHEYIVQSKRFHL